MIHQLGSASNTPGGKFLLVGPRWHGQKPDGFIDVLGSPTNVTGVFGRSFAAHSDEAKAKARAVLNQTGMVGLSKDKPGPHTFDCEASARNKVYPPGLTAEMLTADPDMLRVGPVNPVTFWDDLEKVLDANPEVGSDDAAMAAQARTLISMRVRAIPRQALTPVMAGNVRKTAASGNRLVWPRPGGGCVHLRLSRGDLLHSRR